MNGDSSPPPFIEEKEVDYVPDIEANAFVPKEEPVKRTFTLRLNIGVKGEHLKEDELPQMIKNHEDFKNPNNELIDLLNAKDIRGKRRLFIMV
jgi:hypothetical protein